MSGAVLGSRVIIMYKPPDMVLASKTLPFYLYLCLAMKQIRELSIAMKWLPESST